MSQSGKYQIKQMLSKAQIAKRVEELGVEITQKFQDTSEPLILLGILKGSVIFLSDLARSIQLPIELEFMGVSTYGNDVKSSKNINITLDITRSLEGSHVIIVEDIFDSGFTLGFLQNYLKSKNCNSLTTCALLDKKVEKMPGVEVDFTGFEIPDKFVVGYGLDVAGSLRNLPNICEVML